MNRLKSIIVLRIYVYAGRYSREREREREEEEEESENHSICQNAFGILEQER